MIALKSISSLVFAGAMLATGSAVAVPVTIVGNTVSFTFDSALAGLFGTPTVNGDSIFFTPTNFKVFSSNDGFEQISQTFNIAITANAGFQIAGVDLCFPGACHLRTPLDRRVYLPRE